MTPDADEGSALALRKRLEQRDVRRTALVVELSAVLGTGIVIGWAFGPVPTLRYLSALLAALLAQQLFVAAMRRRIGPETSSLADALTLGRATVGGVLAGLVASGIQDRLGLIGWLAWGATLLGVTVGDWVDGPLARRLGPTRLGGALDIEADSWLTLWSAAAAVTWGGLPWWCLLAPLAHYAQPLVALRHGGLPRGGDPWWGRVTGVAQMILILAALAPAEWSWREAALGMAALPISGAQLLVMLLLLFQRSRTHESSAAK